MMRSKIIHLVRHGQATHNVRAEPARAAGCSFEDFIQLMREDDQIDSQLTDAGLKQAEDVKKTATELTPQLIVVSPLSRAIDTGFIVFGTTLPYVCRESLRERNGLLLNGKRQPLAYLQEKYLNIDFENIPPGEDDAWNGYGANELETPEACSQRAYESLLWVVAREETEVAVVAHGGLFHQMTNGLPELIKCDKVASERFHNCELRTLRLRWEESTSDDDTKMVLYLEAVV